MSERTQYGIRRHGLAFVLASIGALGATLRTGAASISDERGNIGYDTAAECDAAVAAGTARFYAAGASQPPSKRADEVDVKTITLRELVVATRAAARHGYRPAGYTRGACDLGVAGSSQGDGINQPLVGKWIAYSPNTRLNAYSNQDGMVVRVTLKPSDTGFAKGLPRPVGDAVVAAERRLIVPAQVEAAAAPTNAVAPARTAIVAAAPTISVAASPLDGAQGGMCYATVVTPPRFETRAETVVKIPATKRSDVVPATYKDVEERVLVSPEHKRQIPVPATYKTVYEDVVVRPAGEREEPVPATFTMVQERVLVKAESKRIEVTPATYRTVTEQVIDKPESKSVRVFPATFKTEERRVVDRPASTRVETVPATFKTVTERVMATPESVRYEPLTLPMRTVAERVLVSPGGRRLEAVPVAYKTVTERVVAKEASKQLVEVPAEYLTLTERVKVADATKEWKRGRAWLGNALQVSSVGKLALGPDGTVNGVKVDMSRPVGTTGVVSRSRTGVRRTGRAVGPVTGSAVSTDPDDDVMCLVEVPERYETITRQVVKTPATVREIEVPAEYTTVTRQVVDRPAGTRTAEVPASYQTVTRQELDLERMKSLGYKFDEKGDVIATPTGAPVLRAASVPGWKSTGAGPAGASPTVSAGAASGVEGYVVEVPVPATYRDEVRTILATPATVRTVEAPATHKTVMVRVEVTPERTDEVVIPATYKTVTRRVVDREATTREVVIPAEYRVVDRRIVGTPASTRKIPVPAVTEKVARRVIDTPAGFREEVVPAVYQTLTRRVIDRPASIREVEVPSVTETIYNRIQVAEATSARRAVLCETNATVEKIRQLQQALKQAGFDPGIVDGRIGPHMVTALIRFQEAKNLPVDDGRVINLETVKALGVSPE